MSIENTRKPDYPVSDIFISRQSTRLFSSEEVGPDKLNILFEASRWSPSCYNDQPWMYVYADKEEDLAVLRDLLVSQNRQWADHAPVLAILFARKHFVFNSKENAWAEFDAGAAWMSLALQAHDIGLSAHAMAGFDKSKACEALGVPEDEYIPVVAIAIGYRDASELLDEAGVAKEDPTERRAVETFVYAGRYGVK